MARVGSGGGEREVGGRGTAGATPAFIYTLPISITRRRFVSHHASLGAAFSGGDERATACRSGATQTAAAVSTSGPWTCREERRFKAFVIYAIVLSAPWWG